MSCVVCLFVRLSPVMAAVKYDECQHYDPKLHRKLYQNANPFIVRRYDGRIKKCRGCRVAFKSATVRTRFIIAHRELYVYGRIKGSKRILTAERDIFYHCDLACIEQRHPYFYMCDVLPHPTTMHQQLNDSDVEHLQSLGIFV